MHCKKTFATFLCQNSGTILIITYVFCYQSNFLIFAGEHFYRGEHFEENTFLGENTLKNNTFLGENTLGRTQF